MKRRKRTALLVSAALGLQLLLTTPMAYAEQSGQTKDDRRRIGKHEK